MQEVKCGYLGSATLAENIDPVSVPQGVAPLMAEISDPIIRETLRDFGCNQGFRRDLYRRGVQPLAVAEHSHLLDQLGFAWTGTAAADPITINTPLGQVQGKAEIYQPLMAMLEAGPLSVRTAREIPPFAGRPLQELLQALTLITSAGYAHPGLAGGDRAEARAGAARLNQALARMGEQGGELTRLVSPVLGTAFVVDLLEQFAVAGIMSGKPAELASLSQVVIDSLGRAGRTMQRDGQPVADPREARKIVETEVARMLETRQTLWRLWGVV
jgi:Predicted methyltransferase regulatory domain